MRGGKEEKKGKRRRSLSLFSLVPFPSLSFASLSFISYSHFFFSLRAYVLEQLQKNTPP